MLWYWVLGWIFTVLALLGNGLVIFLVIFKLRLRTLTNCFIASLAVADFFAALTFFPFRFISHCLYEIDLGHPGVWYKVCFTFIYCSTTNLCVLTADRYMAIVKPLKYVSFKQGNLSLIISLFAAWVTPLIFFTLPAALSYRGNDDFTMGFETNRVFTFQVFPCIFFLYVAIHLIYIVRKAKRQVAVLVAQLRYNHVIHQSTISKNLSSPERRNSAMIILIITLFNITFAGGNYLCYCFITKACVVPDTAAIKKIILLLFIVNSTANPIVYAFFKKDIRKEFLRLFKRKSNR